MPRKQPTQERAAATRYTRFICVHHATRMSHLGVTGREHACCRLELRRMDALLAVEPHRAGNAARAFESGEIAVVGVRSVDAAQSVRARACDDAVHRRMPAMPGV